MTCIYVLKDRATGEVRYVGKADCPVKRLKSHMRDARRRDTPVYRWIRKIGEPVIEVLEECGDDWKEAERRIISELRAQGARLLNVAEGGDQPFCPPELRSQNARTATAKRSDALWRLYRSVGQHAGWAKRQGNDALAAKCRYAIERMKNAEAHARANGTLDQLESRVREMLQRRGHNA